MADAKIITPQGISVELHGTPEDITKVVEELERKVRLQTTGGESSKAPKAGKTQIRDLVQILKSEDFFKTPRGLGEIQKKFAEMGHHYPLTTLSGAMQIEAKARRLRRFKQDGKYVYVQ